MRVINEILEWQTLRKQFEPSLSIGLVPTMGNLHRGHASLIQQSKRDNDRTIVTLFVNPTQFNNPDDFHHYPKTIAQDLNLLSELGIDYCLQPTTEQLYCDDFNYKVTESNLSNLMEGRARPGHFTGVLTVVLKLFLLTQPQRAYFGEKDYQQLQLLRGMVSAFFLNCEIIACPTVREASQLAYSSRNNRLNPEQRQRADAFATIFHSYSHCEQMIPELEQRGITVDYLEEHYGRRFVAVSIDDIRLIDNYPRR